MVPRTLLNDGRVLNRRHALGGAARQDHAQARLQRGWLDAEDGGVVNRVRHHLLHVVARLAEGNGLDEDRALDRGRTAPQAGARGARGVRRRGGEGGGGGPVWGGLGEIRAQRGTENRL